MELTTTESTKATIEKWARKARWDVGTMKPAADHAWALRVDVPLGGRSDSIIVAKLADQDAVVFMSIVAASDAHKRAALALPSELHDRMLRGVIGAAFTDGVVQIETRLDRDRLIGWNLMRLVYEEALTRQGFRDECIRLITRTRHTLMVFQDILGRPGE